MKKLFTLLLGIAIISSVNSQVITDSLSMYPGYSSDIFYSCSDGEIANVPRAGWDIAFYTNAFSAGIIINEGAGVELYSYPNGDTTAWSTVDTVGLSSWKPLYNSPEYWEDGAFNANQLGHPDYGWGIYNMITHSVTGDSLYVIKTNEGEYKKLWIVQKKSVDNIYVIRYADLNGENEVNKSLDIKPYTEKNFVYYSMSQQILIDREPNANWDILFTKYIDFTEDMSGNMVEYLVTGATSNIDKGANKFTEVGADFDAWASEPFNTLKNTIGYDWKSFSMTTFSWEVDDSTVFFMQDDNSDVYKIVFTYWQGSSTGKFALDIEMVSTADVDETSDSKSNLSVYPNPSSDYITISHLNNGFNNNVIITDVSGRIVYQDEIGNSKKLSISDYQKGVYFVTIIGDTRESSKFIVY